MDENIRSHYIYERHPAYPAPPRIPLPTLDELYALEDLSLKRNIVTQILIRCCFKLSGLSSFYNQLNQNLEHYLQTTNLRSRALYLPVVSATLALKDDPQKKNMIERAVSLLLASRSLFTDIHSGRLSPDKIKDQPLEMGQYANFFSTNITITHKQIQLFKSKNDRLLLVIIRNQMFLVEIDGWQEPTFSSRMRKTLTHLVQLAKDEAPPVGSLSAPAALTQLKIFKVLRTTPQNQQNLERLKHVWLTLCLEPTLSPLTLEEAFQLAHSTHFGNRWWHSSLQLVVFANGKSCAIGNFSTYLDGNVMMRGVAEIQKRAAQQVLSKKNSGALFPFEALKWRVPPNLFKMAQKDLTRIKDDQAGVVATFDFLGSDFFTQRKVPAIPSFVTALYCTFWQLLGTTFEIQQFVSLAHYRYMDLTTTAVSTSEVHNFCVSFTQNPRYSPEMFQAFWAAIRSQQKAVQKAREKLSFADILPLFLLNRSAFNRFRARLFIAPLLRVLKLFKQLNLGRREILISHPALFPEVPLVGRPGVRLPYVKYFSLHYQIWPRKIVVTYMPSVNWQIPNSVVTHYLQANLEKIKKLIEIST